MATKIDARRVIREAYDETNSELKTVSVGSSSGDATSKLSWEQIIRKSYDEAQGKLRTVRV